MWEEFVNLKGMVPGTTTRDNFNHLEAGRNVSYGGGVAKKKVLYKDIDEEPLSPYCHSISSLMQHCKNLNLKVFAARIMLLGNFLYQLSFT